MCYTLYDDDEEVIRTTNFMLTLDLTTFKILSDFWGHFSVDFNENNHNLY